MIELYIDLCWYLILGSWTVMFSMFAVLSVKAVLGKQSKGD